MGGSITGKGNFKVVVRFVVIIIWCGRKNRCCLLKTVRMEWEELFEFDSNLAGYDDRIEDPFPSKQLLSSFLLARRKRDNPLRFSSFSAKTSDGRGGGGGGVRWRMNSRRGIRFS